MLGIEGAKSWERSASDWRENMRGFSGEMMGTRLTEAAERGKIDAEGGATSMMHNELAIVKDNGLKNDYRVNYELVNSKAYHDKFMGLTGSKLLDEALYKQATKMLEHRSGTEYEDIAMLDSRTGKFLVGNDKASGEFKHKCGLSREDADELASMGKKFEILHNHPGSSIPSTADIQGLFNRSMATGSTIPCHNGTVYRLKKLRPIENINELVSDSYSVANNKHPNWSKPMIENYVSDMLLERLVKSNFLSYDRR